MTNPKPVQLGRLVRPIPSNVIAQRVGRGGSKFDYVGHAMITEMLLLHVGPFEQRIVETIRDGDTGKIVAVVLEHTYRIDGQPVVIQEVGEVEERFKQGGGEDITGHDGERLKLAVSDGVKRCAARVGLGLGLWSRNGDWLYEALKKRVQAAGGTDSEPELDAPEPAPLGEDEVDPDGQIGV